jgi:hypothetical protein
MEPATAEKAPPSRPKVEPTTPLVLTTLDTELEFSHQCELIAVTSRGCLIRSLRPLQKGTPVRLESLSGRHSISGRVAFSAASENAERSWRIGIDVEHGQLAIVLAEGQKGQPQAAALTQGAATEPTPATVTAATTDGPPPSTAHPKDYQARPNRSSGQQVSTERPSADEILKLFQQRIRQKLDTISSSFEAGLQQEAAQLLNRTGAELESRVSSQVEHLRTQVEASTALAAKLHEQSEGRLQHWRAGLQDIEAKSGELRQLSSALEKRTAEIQRNIEEGDRQITQRLQEYSKFADERFNQSREQIKSNVQASVKVVHSQIESFGREVLARIEDAAKKNAELLRRLDEAGVRLGNLAEAAESTLEKSLLQLKAEAMEGLQKEIDARIQRSGSQLESTLAKAMESFCGAWRDPS